VQANTNNVHAIWALLQTTRGKYEPKIFACKYRNGHLNMELRT